MSLTLGEEGLTCRHFERGARCRVECKSHGGLWAGGRIAELCVVFIVSVKTRRGLEATRRDQPPRMTTRISHASTDNNPLIPIYLALHSKSLLLYISCPRERFQVPRTS